MIAMVDQTECVATAAKNVGREANCDVATPFRGDASDAAFRRSVFETVGARYGTVSICVPAAGITRDAQPTEEEQGVGVLVGSVSSQGNKGQLSYATTKAALEGAAATLQTEAIFHGVRCAVIHPGYTDTPMVRALGEDYIARNILPFTQLGRLVRPAEIADAIRRRLSWCRAQR